MCAPDHHCPFLNRPDARCSQHFHLSELQHAFEHCFDQYTACPVYLERLVERRVRQIESREEAMVLARRHEALEARQPRVQVTVRRRAMDASEYVDGNHQDLLRTQARGLVELSIAARRLEQQEAGRTAA
jgi:hypothetical protein